MFLNNFLARYGWVCFARIWMLLSTCGYLKSAFLLHRILTFLTTSQRFLKRAFFLAASGTLSLLMCTYVFLFSLFRCETPARATIDLRE